MQVSGWIVHAFESVTSTMDVAHRLAVEGAPDRTLVWAARQEQGRGRLGRTWASPEGGVYLSLILKPSRPPAEIPQLSLVAGLAVAEAIQELTGLFASIRWPNDLLINEQKVAGILAEGSRLRAEGDSRSLEPRALSLAQVVIIGIGINVTTDPSQLPDTATSLNSAFSIQHSELLYRLTGEVCRHFSVWYDRWLAQGFAPIREALRPWIGLFGHPVLLTAGSHRFEGTAVDIDEQGRLVVRLDSGILRAFEAGEVTRLR